jgi:hypothetical protein
MGAARAIWGSTIGDVQDHDGGARSCGDFLSARVLEDRDLQRLWIHLSISNYSTRVFGKDPGASVDICVSNMQRVASELRFTHWLRNPELFYNQYLFH